MGSWTPGFKLAAGNALFDALHHLKVNRDSGTEINFEVHRLYCIIVSLYNCIIVLIVYHFLLLSSLSGKISLLPATELAGYFQHRLLQWLWSMSSIFEMEPVVESRQLII